VVTWRGGLGNWGEVIVEEVVGLAGLCEFVHVADVSIGKVSVLAGSGTIASRECGL